MQASLSSLIDIMQQLVRDNMVPNKSQIKQMAKSMMYFKIISNMQIHSQFEQILPSFLRTLQLFIPSEGQAICEQNQKCEKMFFILQGNLIHFVPKEPHEIQCQKEIQQQIDEAHDSQHFQQQHQQQQSNIQSQFLKNLTNNNNSNSKENHKKYIQSLKDTLAYYSNEKDDHILQIDAAVAEQYFHEGVSVLKRRGTLGPGDLLGDSEVYSATSIALNSCIIAVVKRTQFLEVFNPIIETQLIAQEQLRANFPLLDGSIIKNLSQIFTMQRLFSDDEEDEEEEEEEHGSNNNDDENYKDNNNNIDRTQKIKKNKNNNNILEFKDQTQNVEEKKELDEKKQKKKFKIKKKFKYMEGDQPRYVYILLQGEVRIFKNFLIRKHKKAAGVNENVEIYQTSKVGFLFGHEDQISKSKYSFSCCCQTIKNDQEGEDQINANHNNSNQKNNNINNNNVVLLRLDLLKLIGQEDQYYFINELERKGRILNVLFKQQMDLKQKDLICGQKGKIALPAPLVKPKFLEQNNNSSINSSSNRISEQHSININDSSKLDDSLQNQQQQQQQIPRKSMIRKSCFISNKFNLSNNINTKEQQQQLKSSDDDGNQKQKQKIFKNLPRGSLIQPMLKNNVKTVRASMMILNQNNKFSENSINPQINSQTPEKNVPPKNNNNNLQEKISQNNAFRKRKTCILLFKPIQTEDKSPNISKNCKDNLLNSNTLNSDSKKNLQQLRNSNDDQIQNNDQNSNSSRYQRTNKDKIRKSCIIQQENYERKQQVKQLTFNPQNFKDNNNNNLQNDQNNQQTDPRKYKQFLTIKKDTPDGQLDTVNTQVQEQQQCNDDNNNQSLMINQQGQTLIQIQKTLTYSKSLNVDQSQIVQNQLQGNTENQTTTVGSNKQEEQKSTYQKTLSPSRDSQQMDEQLLNKIKNEQIIQRTKQKLKRSSTNINDGQLISNQKNKEQQDPRRFSSTFILKDGSKFQIIEQKYTKASLKEVIASSDEEDSQSDENSSQEEVQDNVQQQKQPGEEENNGFGDPEKKNKLSIKLPRNSCTDSETKSIIMQIPNFCDNLSPFSSRRPSASSLFVSTTTNAALTGTNNGELRNQYQNAQFSNYLYQIKEEQNSPLLQQQRLGQNTPITKASRFSNLAQTPKTAMAAQDGVSDNQHLGFSKICEDRLRKQKSIPIHFQQPVSSPQNQSIDFSNINNNNTRKRLSGMSLQAQQTPIHILQSQNSQVFNQSCIKYRKNSKRTSFASSINNTFFMEMPENFIEVNNINNEPLNPKFCNYCGSTKSINHICNNNIEQVGSPSNRTNNSSSMSKRDQKSESLSKRNDQTKLNNNGLEEQGWLKIDQENQNDRNNLFKQRKTYKRKSANVQIDQKNKIENDQNNNILNCNSKLNPDQKRTLYHQKSAQLDDQNVQNDGDQRANAFIAEAIKHQIKEDFIKIPNQKKQILSKQPSISLCLQQEDIMDLQSNQRQSRQSVNYEKELSELLISEVKSQQILQSQKSLLTVPNDMQLSQKAQLQQQKINNPDHIYQDNIANLQNLIDKQQGIEQLSNKMKEEQENQLSQQQYSNDQQNLQQQQIDQQKQIEILQNFSIDKYFKPQKKIQINCEKIRSHSQFNGDQSNNPQQKLYTCNTQRQNYQMKNSPNNSNSNISTYQIDKVILEDILNLNKLQKYCTNLNKKYKQKLQNNSNYNTLTDNQLSPVIQSQHLSRKVHNRIYSSNQNIHSTRNLNSQNNSFSPQNNNFPSQSLQNLSIKQQNDKRQTKQSRFKSDFQSNNSINQKSNISHHSEKNKQQQQQEKVNQKQFKQKQMIIRKFNYSQPKNLKYSKYQLLLSNIKLQKNQADHIFKFNHGAISLKEIRSSLQKWFQN